LVKGSFVRNLASKSFLHNFDHFQAYNAGSSKNQVSIVVSLNTTTITLTGRGKWSADLRAKSTVAVEIKIKTLLLGSLLNGVETESAPRCRQPLIDEDLTNSR
jgi:hypothetical protein